MDWETILKILQLLEQLVAHGGKFPALQGAALAQLAEHEKEAAEAQAKVKEAEAKKKAAEDEKKAAEAEKAKEAEDKKQEAAHGSRHSK